MLGDIVIGIVAKRGKPFVLRIPTMPNENFRFKIGEAAEC